MAPSSEAVPLTAEQRRSLRAQAIVPAVVIVPILLALLGMMALVSAWAPPSQAVRAFLWIGVGVLVVVAAGIGMHIGNTLGDAGSAARVHQGYLADKTTTGRNTRTHYAEFQHLGKLVVPTDLFETLRIGNAYRVIYSPRTRRAWSAAPITVRRRDRP